MDQKVKFSRRLKKDNAYQMGIILYPPLKPGFEIDRYPSLVYTCRFSEINVQCLDRFLVPKSLENCIFPMVQIEQLIRLPICLFNTHLRSKSSTPYASKSAILWLGKAFEDDWTIKPISFLHNTL